MKKFMFILLFGGIVCSLSAQSTYQVELNIGAFDTSSIVFLEFDKTLFHYFGQVEFPEKRVIPFPEIDLKKIDNLLIVFKSSRPDSLIILQSTKILQKLPYVQVMQVHHYFENDDLYIEEQSPLFVNNESVSFSHYGVYTSLQKTFFDDAYILIEKNNRAMIFKNEFICEYSLVKSTFPVLFYGKSIYCYAYKKYTCGYIGFLTKAGWNVYSENGEPLVVGARKLNYYRKLLILTDLDWILPDFPFIASGTADVLIGDSTGIVIR